MSKILLTGCAGFIGWKTAEILLNQNHRIIGIDNLNDYYDVSLKNYRLNQLKKNSHFFFSEIDIENREALKKLFKQYEFDTVINLAARAGVRYSEINPHVYMTTNANGTLNLLQLMKEHQINKFVLASTSSLYAGCQMPFQEDLPVNTPISQYAASKKAAETMAYTYHYLYELDVTILRYFTVYGPAGRPDMSPLRFVKWIAEGTPITLYGDGTQARDFTFVDDIACGTIKGLKKTGYEIINLGGGNHPISLNEMIQLIEKYLDKKAVIDQKPVHKTDMKTTWADISKAKKLLDWGPQINFETGIKKTVDWYLENQEWVKEIQV